MSKFVTRIAVDMEAVQKLLPKGTFVCGSTWNGSEVELTWVHDHLESPWTFEIEYPLELLKERRLPPGVRMREARTNVRTAGPDKVAGPRAPRGKGKAVLSKSAPIETM